MKIDVCVASYKRPDKLKQLLESLHGQQLPDDITIQVIVVDNDKNETAREVVEQFKLNGLQVIYDVEPEQNIALARNRGVAHTTGDYVAFIDDDEIAVPDWLAQLIKTAQHYEASAVFGPVIPLLPNDTPKWAKDGGFYERPQQKTGELVPYGRTGNALVETHLLKSREPTVFLPELGLTGGSDFAFFNEIKREGGKMIWCDEAAVTEVVEEHRISVKWLLLRAFRGGQVFAIHSGKRPKNILRLALWALIRLAVIFVAIVLSAILIPFSRIFSIKALQKASSYLGQLVSLSHFRYREYASR